MIYWDDIKLDFEPRKRILPLLPSIPSEPEMTEFESAFLCGVIKRFKPDKIVEVGIAGGGTTAIIIQCLEELENEECEMYSIDYAKQFYRGEQYVSGYLGEEAVKVLKPKNVKHRFLYEKVACAWSEEIGDNIDCLILDTTHTLPGEVLEFITILPAIKNGGVVILHDISYNLITRGKEGYATPVLLASVTADKYLNHDRERKTGQYPNIAAFLVNEETRKNIESVFLSLMATWNYIPLKDQAEDYKASIIKNYDEKKVALYDIIMSLQKNSFVSRDKKYRFPFHLISKNDRVIIYGAGKVGQEYVRQMSFSGYGVLVKWVDVRYEEMPLFRVNSVDEIFTVEFDYIIIAIASCITAKEIENELIEKGIDKNKILWRDPLKWM